MNLDHLIPFLSGILHMANSGGGDLGHTDEFFTQWCSSGAPVLPSLYLSLALVPEHGPLYYILLSLPLGVIKGVSIGNITPPFVLLNTMKQC